MALTRIEVDADAAALLRRCAARRGDGVSTVLQEALTLYARERGWSVVHVDDADPDESQAEDVAAMFRVSSRRKRELIVDVADGVVPEDILERLQRAEHEARRRYHSGLKLLCLFFVVFVAAAWVFVKARQ
ncbi:MAG: hypothetical protein GWN84_13735 [Gammaproteobacteria bacterium]|nr:hypothetical protein [Gammaproteobacteria bacterium]NIR83880.1 hypothetical protein [Gammaproteobacteria bacterium]NIU05190.1 hypothetical protein [Gammaproteobacteria bacterium]NIV52038.1 hypothetical protein [Gammaproteobacteria bacterium]NIX86463.1 hypothetical protein [Gammaproteobacteria bacterium]